MNESFLRDIRAQPDTLRGSLDDLREQVGRFPDLGEARRMVLSGSGDSYIAALAVAPLFEEHLGLPVVALPSLDACGFRRWEPQDVLVVTSVSGEVARSIEAAERARGQQARTIAITSDAGSTLAAACDAVLVTPPSIDRSTPHARDYTVALLAFGALLERSAGRSMPELDAWPDLSHRVLDEAFDDLRDEAAAHRSWFLGSGPDVATARYGALKFWEAAGLEAWWDDLEEFAHGSLLMARPGDRAIVVTSGRGSSLAAQMLPGLERLGLRVITVGPQPIAEGALHLDAGALDGPGWQPFTSCLPLQVLTYIEARHTGRDVSSLLDGRPYARTYALVHREWVRAAGVTDQDRDEGVG